MAYFQTDFNCLESEPQCCFINIQGTIFHDNLIEIKMSFLLGK